MMESRILAVALLAVAVNAGVVPTYPAAPLTTIAKISAPLPYAAPRLTYASAPAYATHAAPVAYAAQATPVAYASHAAPVAYASHAAPVAYAQPAPVQYAAHAAPLAYASHAAPVSYAQPAPVQYAAHAPAYAKAVVPAVDTDYDPNPSYNYAYDIQDTLTGDSKNQQESRQGDVVQGSYSLTEPDGTRRTVEYTADPVNGFNAVVHREPAVVQKTVVAAPAYAKVAAPVAYAAHAPLVAHPAPVAYAAPVAHAPVAYAKTLATPVGYSTYH